MRDTISKDTTCLPDYLANSLYDLVDYKNELYVSGIVSSATKILIGTNEFTSSIARIENRTGSYYLRTGLSKDSKGGLFMDTDGRLIAVNKILSTILI